MNYEEYAKIRDSLGFTDYKVAKLSGVGQSTFTDWKNGRSTPKTEKLYKIKFTLGIISTNETEENHYYLDEETRQYAEVLRTNKEMKLLFDAAQTASPEDLKMVADLLMRMKNGGNNND